MFHKCKVTVIKRTSNMELVHSYMKSPDNFKVCDRVKDNRDITVLFNIQGVTPISYNNGVQKLSTKIAISIAPGRLSQVIPSARLRGAMMIDFEYYHKKTLVKYFYA